MLIKKMFVLILISVFTLSNAPRVHAFNDRGNLNDQNFILKNFSTSVDLVLRSSRIQRVILKFSKPSVVKHSEYLTKNAIVNSSSRVSFVKTKENEINENVAKYQRYLKNIQDRFLTSIPESVDYKILGQWQSIYNGIALEIKGYDLLILSKNPSIEFIYSDNEEFFPVRDIAIQTVRRNEIEYLREKYSTLPINPTNDIRIGIVDSGIDYNHPDFYPTGFKNSESKVMGGWDCFYTVSDEEDSDENEDRPGDPDPMDDSKYTRGHGTHVAGIAAGNNPDDPLLQGVCPDASLFAYKVFPSNKSGGAPSYTIISACELAMEDKCSVINLSLGHDGEVPSIIEDSPYFDAFQNAAKAGVMIVASAGNDGGRTENNLWPIHAPGVFDGVFQVGASDERLLQPFSICYPTNRHTIYGFQSRFSAPFDDTFDGIEIVECGFGSEEEFSQVEVSGKLALIQRGPKDNGISFHDKNLNAKKAGAKACIITNYDNRSFSPTLSIDGNSNPYLEEFIPCMMVSFETQELLQHIANGFGYIDFKKRTTQIASYTSSGPCFSFNDGFFKPEICAPGTAIYSSIPTLDPKIDGPLWSKKQGTSMATPVVTGCAALLRYKYPDLSIQEIQSLMMNTSTILYNPLTEEAFPFFYQGAGEVNLKNAFESPILTNPGYSIVD
ncbi:MAG: S8 family serine peptidase, partial [Caldisericia bacterium]|nr:S8 family serine peptidase [Caldisericia bacterium]